MHQRCSIGSDVISSSKEDSAGVLTVLYNPIWEVVVPVVVMVIGSYRNIERIDFGLERKSFPRSEIAARADLVRDAEKMLSRGILSSGYGRVPESYTSPTRRLWPELIINAHCNPVTAVSIRRCGYCRFCK